MKTVFSTVCLLLLIGSLGRCQPTCVDQRLEINLFAEAPNIVQPVSAVVDQQGRLLVIENHTHFRPEEYVGPSTDRILIMKDKDQDGSADSFEVFFEGEKDSMDLAVAPNGAIYLATRRKILRLEDNDKDGKVDRSETIVRLETDGDYPHNGLSGLVFDLDGMLQFGFGENLGVSYKLFGSDRTELVGGAEGGSTYRCTPEGKQLERVSTGFWNPFGQCMDAYGNIFAVDNDPDATPPCRLLHVTEGANFGYQFRYGRPGNHPLQTWTGELPGTIGMVAGTGEAPCEIIYCMPSETVKSSDGLPEDYVGDLLVASWGDHRIERFRLERKGASFEATRTIIVQGDTNFWPVGIAVAKDGSLFVTDWGSRSYPLHGEGKVWRLSAREGKNAEGRKKNPIVRQIELATRMRNPDTSIDELVQIANSDNTIELRAMAVRLLGKRGHDIRPFAAKKRSLPIRREAFRYLDSSQLAVDALQSRDPTLRSLATRALAQNQSVKLTDLFAPEFLQSPPKSGEQMAVGAALVCETINSEALQSFIPAMLQSKSDDVRLVAARWVADHKLEAYLPDIQREIGAFRGNFRLLLAFIAVEQHLNGGKLNDESLKEALSRMLADESLSENTKTLAIQAAKPNSLDLELIKRFIDANQEGLRRETIYLLLDDQRPEALPLLSSIVDNDTNSANLRADALVVADQTAHDVERLVSFTSNDSDELRLTAARLLTGEKLTEDQRRKLPKQIQTLLDTRSAKKPRSVAEVLQSVSSIKSKGNANSGRRLFHNTRLLQCAKCHRVENRGADIGPELTGIAKSQSAEQLLRSIMHPSERIAPQYQPWTIVDQQGRAKTGYHLASKKLVETFVDSNGEQFEIAQDEIDQRIAGEQSIMPTGLIDHLNPQEVADLLAYLSE